MLGRENSKSNNLQNFFFFYLPFPFLYVMSVYVFGLCSVKEINIFPVLFSSCSHAMMRTRRWWRWCMRIGVSLEAWWSIREWYEDEDTMILGVCHTMIDWKMCRPFEDISDCFTVFQCWDFLGIGQAVRDSTLRMMSTSRNDRVGDRKGILAKVFLVFASFHHN